jgi:hypothetical protein
LWTPDTRAKTDRLSRRHRHQAIGDFVGHRSPASTDIYAKVAVESLREVALGDGEEALQ